jgi:Domain of unknown function (DUF932)
MSTQFNDRIKSRFLAAALFEGRGNQPLTETQLYDIAPSIFAVEKHSSRSARFSYIPTWDAVQALIREGFEPVAAMQGRSRTEGKAEFTKHLVRFQHQTGAMQGREGIIPEVILMNAHDGTSSYRVMGGAFRPICKNGLVAADIIDDVRIGHTGDVVDKVIEGTWSVVEKMPAIADQSRRWQDVQLTREEQHAFALATHELRLGELSEATAEAIDPDWLIAPRRTEDRGSDLWRVFNRAQENALRGGIEGVAVREDREGRKVRRRVTTRPVGNIDGQTALNRAMWRLAAEMERLKNA